MADKKLQPAKEIQEVKQQPFNIDNLISQAITNNVSVESLSRLLDMRKSLKDEWASEEFVKALATFQGQCPIIEKKKKVSFNTTNYSYAPLEVIVDQVKELLTQNGFSYMFDTETNGKMKVICNVYHSAGHMKSTKFDMEIDTNAKMNVSQKYGSALTYAKRYAFCAAFGINVRDEDTDTADHQNNTQTSSPSNARQEETPKTTNSTTRPYDKYLNMTDSALKIQVSQAMNNGRIAKDYPRLAKANRSELIAMLEGVAK